MILSRNAELD